jgi:formylglycine-generating enzyme required for sulfatase activity
MGMRITRHLRHSIRTSVGTRICTGLINTEIYGYFLMETDHPQQNRHEVDSETPATGVRASDANAFLRWVNSVTGGQPEYRLPTHEEIAESAVQRMLARTPG